MCFGEYNTYINTAVLKLAPTYLRSVWCRFSLASTEFWRSVTGRATRAQWRTARSDYSKKRNALTAWDGRLWRRWHRCRPAARSCTGGSRVSTVAVLRAGGGDRTALAAQRSSPATSTQWRHSGSDSDTGTSCFWSWPTSVTAAAIERHDALRWRGRMSGRVCQQLGRANRRRWRYFPVRFIDWQDE